MNHVWQFLHRAGQGIGRGLLFSLIQGWKFTLWIGHGVGNGLLFSLIKIWQGIYWTVPRIVKGIWLSLTKTWQGIFWAVPRICRGIWFLLSTTWMFFWLIVTELLILLFKMVNGPRRALTVFAALVVLLNLWEHLWGGVQYPALIFLTENPTFTILTAAGILAGLVNLLLFYDWVKSRLYPKGDLPVQVEQEHDGHYEKPKPVVPSYRKPVVPFYRKRVYSDIEKARAIVAMREIGSVPYVSQQLDIPSSTLYSWKNKYQMDSRFRFRIDQVIWLVTRVKMGRYERHVQVETKHRYERHVQIETKHRY